MKQSKTWLLALALVLVFAAAGYGYRTYAATIPSPQTVTTQPDPTESTPVPTEAAATEEPPAPTEQPAPAQDKAPDFTVEDGDGNQISLTDKLDKPVIVNFWATWCPPCCGELPEFQKAWESYGDRVNFMMVNLTDGDMDTVDSVRGFAEENGYTMPIYFDTEYNAVEAYRISAIPVTMAVGQDGTLLWSQVGALDAATLEAVMQDLLQP